MPEHEVVDFSSSEEERGSINCSYSHIELTDGSYAFYVFISDNIGFSFSKSSECSTPSNYTSLRILIPLYCC